MFVLLPLQVLSQARQVVDMYEKHPESYRTRLKADCKIAWKY